MMMKTLVLGLGNPILSDDGAGLRVAEDLRDRVPAGDVTILEAELGGLNLLELLTGYDKVIIVDAIKTRDGKPGDIYRLSPVSLRSSRHINSIHSMDLAAAIEIGQSLGMPIPGDITIFAIEAQNVETFSESCTPAVEKAIARCTNKIAGIIGDFID